MLAVLLIPCVRLEPVKLQSPSLYKTGIKVGGLLPRRGQVRTEVVHLSEGVLGTSELIRSLLLTKNDAHLLLICLARGFPPEGGPQGLAGSLVDGPHT